MRNLAAVTVILAGAALCCASGGPWSAVAYFVLLPVLLAGRRP